MGRPQKQTVDYFPHQCNHGKTIYILEQKYGNNGYAFWFKLLEELGKHEGHFIDLNDESELEFLSAKARVSVTETLEVLCLLSKLGAIDSSLWAKKIIWCTNFLCNIKDVYAKRVVSAPEKPVYSSDTGVSAIGKRQSKVKETKGKETKVSCASPMHTTDFDIFWTAYPSNRRKNKKKAKSFFMKIDRNLFPKIIESLDCQKKTKDWTKENGEFIPHPSTWLRNARWEDEAPVLTREQEAQELVDFCDKTYGFADGQNIASFRFEKIYGNDELLKYKHIFGL